MLTYSTFVAPSKPVVSNDPAPGEKQEMWSPTSSTLIYGDRDAVLVDALATKAEGQALADWISSTGKNLTTIYITHGHGDHFFGAAPVLDRFPQARMVATPKVVDYMGEQAGEGFMVGFWARRFPNQLVTDPPVARPMGGQTVELEGEQLVSIELGHSDTDNTTALHVPSIGLVAAGDSVYNDVHLHLGEAARGGTDKWLASLDTIEALHPDAVVAGHKRQGAEDSPDTIDETREYLRDFQDAVAHTDSPRDLYDSMIERYPDRINRAVVWHSAEAMKG